MVIVSASGSWSLQALTSLCLTFISRQWRWVGVQRSVGRGERHRGLATLRRRGSGVNGGDGEVGGFRVAMCVLQLVSPRGLMALGVGRMRGSERHSAFQRVVHPRPLRHPQEILACDIGIG